MFIIGPDTDYARERKSAYSMNQIERLYMKMVEYYASDPRRIQHFVKVHSFARLIGQGEGIGEEKLFILEAAALVHDIGIKAAEAKYDNCSGRLQEEEGPALAREMLTELGFDAGVIDRVTYLVGHHHTYTNVDGIDYRILLEADFLVNLYEENSQKEAVWAAYEHIFETETGKWLCQTMFEV